MSTYGPLLPDDHDSFGNRLAKVAAWWRHHCPVCRERVTIRALLPTRHPRCTWCYTPGMRNWWACGLPGRRHWRHRSWYTMRLCQALHGPRRVAVVLCCIAVLVCLAATGMALYQLAATWLLQP